MWRPERHCDVDDMDSVLAAEFVEFGRSGRVSPRRESLGAPSRPIHAELRFQRLAIQFVTGDVALVTYLSAVADADEVRHANRSSLWIRAGGGWKLLFHQGTPVVR